MKRIVTIQDISCVGKCSLTVALPIISAMGVEAAIIPTAVLSTHTMFPEFTVKDLTSEIKPISEHWKRADDFRTDNNLILVDPAMADNGKLYPAFDESYAKYMATLCAKADIIVPNVTEACFMLGKEYKEKYDEAYIKELLNGLSALGAKISVLTGVGFEEGKTGVMGYDRINDEYFYFEQPKLPCSYHGTGDIFSSTCMGAMMRGLDWKKALTVAAKYTAECIRITFETPGSNTYGVDFERAVPYLLELLGE